MDTAGLSPRVLVIGLDPRRVPGPWDPEPVVAAIEAGIARFAEHGVGVETCLFGLDGSDDVGAVVAAAAGARAWECVVIGGGVRGDEQLLLFEEIVNVVRRCAPGAAIAFNRTPGDTFEAAARWLEIPGRSAANAADESAQLFGGGRHFGDIPAHGHGGGAEPRVVE